MHALDYDLASGLWHKAVSPCLSLYQPTHRRHPDNRQDPIRYKNLVKSLEESLLRQFSKDKAGALLKPLLALAEDRDFWNHTHDGLAVLRAEDVFRVYVLQQTVHELAIVADSFHTKPLLRILQSADRFQILGVNRKTVRLFEGNRNVVDEVELAQGVPRTLTEALGAEKSEPHLTVASYGGVGPGTTSMVHGHGGKEAEVDIDTERFFRAVDRAVQERHSQPSALPLILAALPEHHHLFHKVSRNPYLLPESIDVHPEALSSLDELRRRAWQLLEPRYLERLAVLAEEYGNAKAKGFAEDDLGRIAKAVAAGRVASLMIEARLQMPGRIDSGTGEIEFGDMLHPQVDDVLDDLADLVMKRGGKVAVVTAEEMPAKTGVAAIYRY